MSYSFLRCGSFAMAMLCFPALVRAMPKPDIAWSTKLNVPVYSPLQSSGGQVYLTSLQDSGPNVFAIDNITGKLVWSFATQGSIAIPPTVRNTQLFVASDVGNIHFMRAINSKTGSLIWEYTRDQPPQCMCSYQSKLSDGLLFAQTDGHSLFAFQPQGAAPSRRLWSFVGDGALLTNPVTADGVVVIGSADRNVYGLEAKTGKILWQQTTGYAFTADPVVVDDIVVAADQGGNMDGFALATGKLLWSTSANGAIDDAAVLKGKTAFFVSEDRHIYALNVMNGQVNWQYTMDDFAAFPPVVVGDSVIVDNRAGDLIALHSSDGKNLWKIDLNGTPFSAPILWDTKKAVVLKIGDHEISAFSTSSGKNIWQYKTNAVVTPPTIVGKTVDLATSQGNVVGLY